MSDEFSGYELALGSVTGIRSWNVDKLGRLVGAASHIWSPGEQSAECSSPMMLQYVGLFGSSASVPGYLRREEEARQKALKDHRLDGCTCGFYAFYDGSTSYHKEGWVDGVISGYGKTVIGTKGFRCEKAKLIALAVPGSARRLGWMPIANGAFGGESIYQAINMGVHHRWWLMAIFIALAAMSLTLLTLGLFLRNPLDRKKVALLRRNYPDVKFYNSKRAMLRHHPLDRGPLPEEPSPESDPQFWTRSAS